MNEESYKDMTPYELLREIRTSKRCIEGAKKELTAHPLDYWERILRLEKAELATRPHDEIARAYAKLLRWELMQ